MSEWEKTTYLQTNRLRLTGDNISETKINTSCK